jgi:hypothetical protein
MLKRATRVIASVGAAALAIGYPRAALAVPFGTSAVTITFAPNVRAERYAAGCRNSAGYASGCVGWRFHGFATPLPFAVETANMLAPARGGRIVAATVAGPQISDDRGASWHAARWEGAGPLSLAFDANSEFGAAVGANGMLYTTDDRGETWRLRRDSSGQRLIDVAVVGQTIVIADDHGGAWVSTDGGLRLRTLSEGTDPAGAIAEISVRERSIWVLVGGSVWWRADANGSVEHTEPPTRRH